MSNSLKTAYENYVATKNPEDEVLPFNLWLRVYEEELREKIADVKRILPFQYVDTIMTITEKVIEVQNAGKATIFVNISGHVQKLELAVYAPFWYPNADPSYKCDFYADNSKEFIEKSKNDLLNYLSLL